MTEFGFRALAAAIFWFVSGGATSAHATLLCENLPPSRLLVYDIKAPEPKETIVPLAELAREPPPAAIAFQHNSMTTVTDLVSYYEIAHRIFSQPNGAVCDSPETVRIGLGASRRYIWMSKGVARDTCVHRALLDHEADHARAFDAAVEGFIDRKRLDFEAAMKALKQTPSPTPEISKTRWNRGVRIFVAEAKQQLLADLRKANAKVDEPEVLAPLETACGGRLRALERLNPANP